MFLDLPKQGAQRVDHLGDAALQFLVALLLLVAHGLLHRLHGLLCLLLRLLRSLHLVLLGLLRGLLELACESPLVRLALRFLHCLGCTRIGILAPLDLLGALAQVLRQRAGLRRGLALRLCRAIELRARLLAELLPVLAGGLLARSLGVTARGFQLLRQAIDAPGELGSLAITLQRRLEVGQRTLRLCGMFGCFLGCLGPGLRHHRRRLLRLLVCRLRGLRRIGDGLVQPIAVGLVSFQPGGEFGERPLESRHPIRHAAFGAGKLRALLFRRRRTVLLRAFGGIAGSLGDAGLFLAQAPGGIAHLAEPRTNLLRELGRGDDPEHAGRACDRVPRLPFCFEGIHRACDADDAVPGLCAEFLDGKRALHPRGRSR